MKVGILTLPLNNNYGGLLQAYALQTYLKDLGVDATLIDIKHFKSQYSTEIKFKMFLYKIVHQTFYIDRSKKHVEEPLLYFNNTYIQPKTEIINNPRKLENLNSCNFDAVIVGSDQVWRFKYTRELITHYFFDFIKNKSTKKISYAASFGTDTWEDDGLVNKIKALLKDFDYRSVREGSGKEICANLFGVETEHVLDPTMLLNKETYIDLFEKENTPENKSGLLEYVLDPNPFKAGLSTKVANQYNLKTQKVKGNDITKMSKVELKNYKYPSVFNWIRGFYDSEYVVTDSFHGTVFCILFNKQFISVGNKERGVTRFSSLLKMFNIENRLVFSEEDISDSLIKEKIDFAKVNQILEEERQKSKAFLRRSLNL